MEWRMGIGEVGGAMGWQKESWAGQKLNGSVMIEVIVLKSRLTGTSALLDSISSLSI